MEMGLSTILSWIWEGKERRNDNKTNVHAFSAEEKNAGCGVPCIKLCSTVQKKNNNKKTEMKQQQPKNKMLSDFPNTLNFIDDARK